MNEGSKLLSVSEVRAYLAPLGIMVREMEADTSTAPLAARALGTTPNTIVKSLLFLAGARPILVLAAGDRKVNARRLAKEVGVAKVRLAGPDDVIAITGYAVGGVPPVAHRQPLQTLIDRHLLDHSIVYAAAGASNAIFPITPESLVALIEGIITDAVE